MFLWNGADGFGPLKLRAFSSANSNGAPKDAKND
jgi:hypothetical protein